MLKQLEGRKEVVGSLSDPLILAMLQLDQAWPKDDSVPWCSATLNFVCHMMGLPRSHSLRARSWLVVGEEVHDSQAEQGFDVVVLGRGAQPWPPKTVLEAPGHVGLFHGWVGTDKVGVYGGNQGDTIGLATFPKAHILAIRRLA